MVNFKKHNTDFKVCEKRNYYTNADFRVCGIRYNFLLNITHTYETHVITN